ncbi:hypothetical protein HAX54_018672 [Datura stramonium]|uniref:Uncharacterized protein n=1 Tax=Datura stramonium TaxID=4076 RepID=A0ABS8UPU2_DATST|nr:hypothetical protein [Datura stramonium]
MLRPVVIEDEVPYVQLVYLDTGDISVVEETSKVRKESRLSDGKNLRKKSGCTEEPSREHNLACKGIKREGGDIQKTKELEDASSSNITKLHGMQEAASEMGAISGMGAPVELPMHIEYDSEGVQALGSAWSREALWIQEADVHLSMLEKCECVAKKWCWGTSPHDFGLIEAQQRGS